MRQTIDFACVVMHKTRSDPREVLSQMMVSSLALVSEPKRGLILGHGGGSLAKWLARHWPTLELDIVEFDPIVVRMAEEYFDYRPRPIITFL